MSQRRAFSAPGKALLAGGYLVLDAHYKSYVVALSARMHAVVAVSHEPRDDNVLTVSVKSAQFNNNQWNYEVRSSDGYKPRERDGLSNPFIQQVLTTVCNYFSSTVISHNCISIDIYSDPQYHSKENTKLVSNGINEFYFHTMDIQDVPKTGLGSSAGLVSVLTTALCSVFKPDLDVENKEHVRMIHNLAQIAHCQAQGKIGSGFDVAAATFGSVIYRRFSPEVISSLPSLEDNNIAEFQRTLKDTVDNVDWKTTADSVNFPPGLKLVMGDVNTGSETVKLVQRVKQWYVDNEPRSLDIYKEIDTNNMRAIASLQELNELTKTRPEYYNKMIESLGSGEISNYPELCALRTAFHAIRKNFRIITAESGAEIEPDVQTTLLDNCETLDGVIAGVVPGAGGYDAIALITGESTDVETETNDREAFQNVKWLKLQQAQRGLQEEVASSYDNLF